MNEEELNKDLIVDDFTPLTNALARMNKQEEPDE